MMDFSPQFVIQRIFRYCLLQILVAKLEECLLQYIHYNTLLSINNSFTNNSLPNKKQ